MAKNGWAIDRVFKIGENLWTKKEVLSALSAGFCVFLKNTKKIVRLNMDGHISMFDTGIGWWRNDLPSPSINSPAFIVADPVNYSAKPKREITLNWILYGCPA